MGPEAGGSGAPEAATGVVTIGSSSTTEGQDPGLYNLRTGWRQHITTGGKEKQLGRDGRAGARRGVRWPVLPPATALWIPHADGSTPGRPGRLLPPFRCLSSPCARRSTRPPAS